MTYFDTNWSGKLVDRGFWFHNMPLPDGTRIAGANHDRNREQKLWAAFSPEVKGKTVLDIGANDGYFSIGAVLAGAKAVTSVNPQETCVGHFPERMLQAQKEWGVETEAVVDDFLNLDDRQYDIILYFGVLYHAEDPLGHIRKMASLLAPGGKIFVETPLTRIQIDRPILEVASDRHDRAPTIYRGQQYVKHVGVGSFFIPNFMALQELCWTCELDIIQLPDTNPYTASLKDRKLFVINN